MVPAYRNKIHTNFSVVMDPVSAQRRV
jgi:hypothetical protein